MSRDWSTRTAAIAYFEKLVKELKRSNDEDKEIFEEALNALRRSQDHTAIQAKPLGIEIVEQERELMVFSFNERREKDPRGPKVTDPDARAYLRQYDRFLKHARLQLVALVRAEKARQRTRRVKR